jgi:DNA-binding NtrC family response regulator
MSKYKIAIVDDEHEILNLLSKFLSRFEDFDVVTFSNPITALSSIDNNYDVVLLDIMMPQKNGLEVLEDLQKKDIKVKVIMMTAYSTLDKVLKSHKEGAVNYLMKPFNSLESVKNEIEKVLQ